MFKISSFEQELVKEMQSRLLANQAENEYSFNKLAKAADYLNNAAELFDDVGMNKQAEAVTKILEKIAQDDLVPEVEGVVEPKAFSAEIDLEINDIIDRIKELKLSQSQFHTLERKLHQAMKDAGVKPLENFFLDKEVVELPEEGLPEEELAALASLFVKKKV